MGDSLHELNVRCGRPDVRFVAGLGDFAVAQLSNRFGVATVALHGAHVMSYVPQGAHPVIWMSEHSKFEPGQPIRGGVPVCWPWFGPDPLSRFGGHGFARLVSWRVAQTETAPGGETSIALELTDHMVPAEFEPYPFKLELTVTLGPALVIALKVWNTGDRTVEYSGALHTYFAVADAAKIQITGLEDCDYFDSVLGAAGVQRGAIVIDREIDRIYKGTSGICRILDPGFDRVIRVAKSGSTSTVVWNPWIAKSQRMSDFGDEEYHTMVCIEAANAPRADDCRTLPPGGRAELRQIISLEA
ncbi:putative glucose-6-phosphate 1-epimerase [bioreactor metagenome]|uniref:glucose-6-phosphate 1-epimerase n=1 Tax=bioreactor metagenome TaxID=1076179 RepID=A0A644XUH1_9ZZZZ